MAVTASDTKPNLLDKQKTNSFGNLDAESMHVRNHYSSRKMTLAKDYKDTKMVSTGAYLDKSMAYQKLIVTRHVKETPRHSGNSQTCCMQD